MSNVNFDNDTSDGTTPTLSNSTSIYDTYDYFIHPHWKQFGPIPDHWHYMVGIYITIVGITGIVGNSIVIWIFSTTKQLKTPSNMLIINLALSDFTFSLVNGFPLLTISAFNTKWMWGDVACQFYGFIGGLFGLMSINTLAAISIDRYINIAYPLTSVRFMTKKNALMMIGIVWIWSLIWAVPPIFGWGAYIPEGFQTSCTFDYLTRSVNNRSYIFGMYIGDFALPLVIIIACYVLIIQAIRNHEKEMIIMAKKLKADDIRKNQEKTRAEVRIAKIAMGIFLLYMLSWSPYATIALIGQFGPTNWVTPLLSELPVLLAKACAMHNPIVYAFSHPKFREALSKRVPWLSCCFKPPKKSVKSTTGSVTRAPKKRQASRVTSADTAEPRDSISEASSCVSNLDDSVFGPSVQMNRTISEMVPNGDYGDVVRELVRALVGVACQQPFLQPIYMSNMSSPTGENVGSQNQAFTPSGETIGSPNQAFRASQSDISSYLTNLMTVRNQSGEVNTDQSRAPIAQIDEAFKLLKDDSKTDLLESSAL